MMSSAAPALAAVLFDPQPTGGRLRRALAGLAMCTAFVLVYLALDYIQFYHWLVTNGLLFATLWALPRRWWTWVFAATWVARLANGILVNLSSGMHGPFLWLWHDPIQFTLGNLAEPFLVVTGVMVLQSWRVLPGWHVNSADITRLHLAALVSALAVTCKDVLYVPYLPLILILRNDGRARSPASPPNPEYRPWLANATTTRF